MGKKFEKGVSIYPLRDVSRRELSGLFLDYIHMKLYHDTDGQFPVHGAIKLLQVERGETVRLQVEEEDCYGMYVLLASDLRITHRNAACRSEVESSRVEARPPKKDRRKQKR